ncbi:MAG TPA: Rne/Rng family ribonuclease [Bacillota bacterium]|jgi:ribonuclease G|nr:Rne/Rng family ribonuclease [Peptococcaceae bacterium MAG4]NLW38789.1 Rne/Rng family ribonuclease [Peptococcaceae bacterium]HPZ43341.1 Rne/Rng family ribonuclease [Bacillota bacterium]HQD76760.1 Rne/Rng family ribonuclease [Bacillota bacterium]HUM58745.1 Rne/Rng family ribonuclease [Bacillota bacterium]
MLKEIVVNVGEEETRVAVLEDNVPVEIYIERSVNQRLVGNIFKGRVENVLPGMQAAFVNIGLEKNAFLYVEDALPARSPEVNEQGGTALGGANICDILKQGQEVLVQIVKEPIGTKGPRVTIHITLPGRYLVLMPTVDYIGISRRIESEKERERLKELAARVKPEGMGVIVRTVAEGVEEEEFRQDINMLTKLWRKILNRAASRPSPNLVHRDLELVQRILRDVFTEDVDRLILDSRYEYEKVLELLDVTDPKLKFKVFYDERENIFEEYGIEQEIEKALKRKVWLKCGGYLVIDQAEALTAIDVNTGKYVGTTNLEDTVLKTNLEAAQEIGRQLRLRNIGGIIIVDFIDMAEESHRQQVLQALEAEIKRDKTKTNILGITQLGLVEMTRKKVRPSLSEVLQKTCPYCEGRGKVLSEETLGIQYKNQIYNMARQTSAQTILVEAHPVVAARLIGSGGANLKDLENKTGKNLYIRGSASHHIESVTIRPLQDNEGVQTHTFPVKPGEVLEVKVEEPHVSNVNDGIARVNGFILDIEGAGSLIGETIPVEVSKVYRTYAKARPVKT